MMKDKNLDKYFQEQWDAADASIPAIDAARMKRVIDKTIASGASRGHSRRMSVRSKWAVAFSCVCLVAAVVMGILLYVSTPKQSDSLCYVNTEKGQRVSMTLSDGTRIWLNSDSELSFKSFENASSRDVYLKGECYFEVAKDARKPFIVHTDVYDVTAVGTAFNVRDYKTDDKVKTTLFEGEVIVKGSGIDTNLLPDEAVVYHRDSHTFTKTLSEQSYYDALWRGNELVVAPGTTLEQLTRILERNYNFQFKFADETIKEYTFEGVIKNCQFASVLDVICLSAPVQYRIEGDRVVFSQKK